MTTPNRKAPKKPALSKIRLGVDERELLISAVRAEAVDCSRPGATHDDRVWSDCVAAVLERLEAIIL